MTDIIDRLVDVRPGGAVDALRRHRPASRDQAQASYDALFTEIDEARATLAERAAVALFVVLLHDDVAAADHYGALTWQAGGGDLADRVAGLALASRSEGPYGEYPAGGPLADESTTGLRYTIAPEDAEAIGARLSAALEHAHLLVFRPRESSIDALTALGHAGWSTDGVVTLSQLVSFLAFQVRVAAGLRLLASEDAA